jgi:hypothetical protein
MRPRQESINILNCNDQWKPRPNYYGYADGGVTRNERAHGNSCVIGLNTFGSFHALAPISFFFFGFKYRLNTFYKAF